MNKDRLLAILSMVLAADPRKLNLSFPFEDGEITIILTRPGIAAAPTEYQIRCEQSDGMIVVTNSEDKTLLLDSKTAEGIILLKLYEAQGKVLSMETLTGELNLKGKRAFRSAYDRARRRFKEQGFTWPIVNVHGQGYKWVKNLQN